MRLLWWIIVAILLLVLVVILECWRSRQKKCSRIRPRPGRPQQHLVSTSTNRHNCCCKKTLSTSNSILGKKSDGLQCLSHYNERFVNIKRPVRSSNSPISITYPTMEGNINRKNSDSTSPEGGSSVLYPIRGAATTEIAVKNKVCAIFVGIGCNYRKTANELLTCVNDVRYMFDLWNKGLDTNRCNPVVFTMIDDANVQLSLNERRFPALVTGWFRMIRKIRELVQENAKKGIPSHVTVMYSGHGYFRHTGRSYGEPDGRSESIVLQDGMIWDYEWSSEFLWQLPKDTHVFGIFDSCHSGTIWNLEFTNSATLPAVYQSTQQPTPRSNGPLIWLLSGCRDSQFSLAGQTSDDLSIATRACIKILKQIFRSNRKITWDSFVSNVQKEVKSLTAWMMTSTKQDPAGAVNYLHLANTPML